MFGGKEFLNRVYRSRRVHLKKRPGNRACQKNISRNCFHHIPTVSHIYTVQNPDMDVICMWLFSFLSSPPLSFSGALMISCARRRRRGDDLSVSLFRHSRRRKEGRGGRLATGGEGRRKEGEKMWVKIGCTLMKKKVFGSVLSPTCFVLFICPIRAPSWRPLLDKIVLFSRPRRVKENRFLANAIHPFWLCAHKNLSPKNPFSNRCFHFSFPGGRQWKNAPYTTPFTSSPKNPNPLFLLSQEFKR